MRTVSAGNSGTVPWISLIAILSISLTVNLPGLAISPIEGRLHTVFPSISELQIQLLEVLPNLVVIPFILLAGKIATRRNQTGVLVAGLVIYALAGAGCLWAQTVNQLIVLSCILGVGCGLVIPLAASLISQYFSGDRRQQVLGTKSGMSNFMVIIATIFVGWMADGDWHRSFLVYLVPVIPLALVPFMSNRFMKAHAVEAAETSVTSSGQKQRSGAKPLKIIVAVMAGLIGLYVAMTFASCVVSYYIPFTMQHYSFDSGKVGVATAMYYLAASVSGFLLPYMIRIFKQATIQAAILLMVVGLFCVALFHSDLSYCLSIFTLGFGYGIIQPVMYDKTTSIAPDKAASTRYFSYLLSGNYIGIACVPFIISGVTSLFRATGSVNFPYWFTGLFTLAVLVLALIFFKGFVFNVEKKQPGK